MPLNSKILWLFKNGSRLIVLYTFEVYFWLYQVLDNIYSDFKSKICLKKKTETVLICNQDHAAVYALRGRRSTMEDRYVMIKIEPELGSGAATVLHAVLDGHGGEVMPCQDQTIFNCVADLKGVPIVMLFSPVDTYLDPHPRPSHQSLCIITSESQE